MARQLRSSIVSGLIGLSAGLAAGSYLTRRGWTLFAPGHVLGGPPGWSRSRGVKMEPEVVRQPEELERRSRLLHEFETGPLRRAIAVGRTTEVGGVTVELLAVELRDTGGLAYLRATLPGRPMPAAGVRKIGPFVAHRHEVPSAFLWPDLRVEDDAGMEYVTGSGGGWSDGHVLRSQVQFAPGVPEAARVLRLTVTQLSGREFAEAETNPDAVEGPWEFEIQL